MTDPVDSSVDPAVDAPVDPSGEQHELVAGPYRAVVTEVGAALRTLTHHGRDLVVGWPAGQPQRLYRGAVLAPWPNRVRDGRYTWAGAEQQLALTEPDRLAALHGLVVWTPWHRLEGSGADGAALALGARVWPQQGYPHALDLRAEWALAAEGPGAGLTWSLTATNVGAAPAPYGASVHPYLVAGPGRADDWTLELDAASTLDVDPERLLPRREPGAAPALTGVGGTDLDLRTPRSLAGVELDHAYTGVGRRRAVLRTADGSGVEMTWGDGLGWVQVHTADRPDPADHRVGVALEPMTCPPDALGTGTDLVALEPGASHTATWRIAALPAGPDGST